ncbi:MAG: outer membrane lipoprotein-sorting protein [Lacunisphaera sp.]|nr:outer membrane lipoprotein-sorting protein [Lacunisphaera sp.]
MVLLGSSRLGLAAPLEAFRPPAQFISGSRPDQSEGARILQTFHQAGISGYYWLAFELRVMPKQGADRTIIGELHGGRNALGPISRLTLPAAAGEQRWLLQSGPQPATWQWLGGAGEPTALTSNESLQAIAGSDLTPFDLQMPFLYWTDFIYEGVAKVRGRPAHSFLLYPPIDQRTPPMDLTGVRVHLDTEFQAFMQAELIGTKGAITKTITILNLKKIGEQWLPKSIDLRNHLTRAKTRLTITAAALAVTLPVSIFAPTDLAKPAPVVPAEQRQPL